MFMPHTATLFPHEAAMLRVHVRGLHRLQRAVVRAGEESDDEIHCNHWWDGNGEPCCTCGQE